MTFKQLWTRLAQYILPTRCVVCQAVGPEVLCTSCSTGLQQVGSAYCLRCGRRRETAFASPDCGECYGQSIGVTRARSCFIYNETGRALLSEFKFQRNIGAGEYLANQLRRWLKEGWATLFNEPDIQLDIAVPVPLHRRRLQERGFNQSLLLARRIANWFSLACSSKALVRTKETASQVGLSANQRRINVRGAFQVPAAKRELVQGQNVLLVDDLMTTGSTLAAGARALKRGGAAMVYGLTLFSTYRGCELTDDIG